jgi:RHS repeat-associated protein
MSTFTTKAAKSNEVKNKFINLRISSCASWFILLFLVAPILPYAEAARPQVPGKKARLHQITVQDNQIPVVFDSEFAVWMRPRHINQMPEKKFLVRYQLYIFDGTTLVRTLTKDEEILLPLNYLRLPKAPPPDPSCDGAPEPLQRPLYDLEAGEELDEDEEEEERGTTRKFAIIQSNLTWDGKDENGNPVSSVNLLYRLEADWIRLNPANNKVKILGTILPHCAPFTVDTGAPVINVTGVTANEFRNTPATIEITITDDGVIAQQEILLDGQPFVSGSTVTDEGQHLLHVSATDNLGNQANLDLQFTIDLTPPQIIFAVPQYINVNVTLSPQIIETNPGTTTILLNGQVVPEGTIVAQDGAYVLQITSVDLAANSSQLDSEFTIDKTAPLITITGVEDGNFYPETRTITINITEANLQSSTILLDGEPFVSGTAVSEEGAHNLVVTTFDLAGNTANRVLDFGIDTIPPDLAILNPEDGDLFQSNAIQVNGSLTENNLQTITINGNPANGGAGQFFGTATLNEGNNTIQVVATDLAGNTDQQSINVTLDSSAPGITITSPANGAIVTGDLIDVTGTATDATSVTVNGVAATLSENNFTATNLRISSGLNTIRAVAIDSAGNSQETSIQVTLDIDGPSITFTQPIDGSITTENSTNVSGFVFDLTGATLTINSANIPLQPDGSFQTTIPLNEGDNPITAVAQDQNGNSETAQINIIRDSTPPTVVSIIPADGSTSVPVDQVIEIHFSEEIKASTVNSTSITFQTGGNSLSATLQTIGDRVVLTPSQPLSGANSYTVTVQPAISDLAGNVLLSGASSTFSTFDTVAPAPPVISPPLPQVTNEPTILVAGTAESGTLVEITGGVARVSVTASDIGVFSAEITLIADAVNQLSITATDLSGNVSEATTVTILQDSVRMVVSNATYQIDGNILIEFSKPVDLTSINPQNIFVIASAVINGTVSPTADPARILFTPDIPLGNVPFLLKIETSVRDQSGQPLEYAFSQIFNGAGGSFVLGEVYDNATGLPLEGAIIRQLSPAANPAPETTSDLTGKFVLPVITGDLLFRIERAGYLSVDRFVTTQPGQAVFMFDARLQPEDSASLQIPTTAAALINSDASVALNVVAGTVANAAAIRLTLRDGQSLPQILPDGWSPVGVAMIDTQAAIQLPFTLRVRNDWQVAPNTLMMTAYFDEAVSVWRLGPSGVVSVEGQMLEVDTQRTGIIAFLIPDFNNPPPTPLPDQPLQPSAPQPSTPGTPSFVATPEGVYPDQRARVDVTFNATQFRSGTKYQSIISEDYQLAGDLGQVLTTPRTADLIGYSNGQPSSGAIRFYAAPASAIDFATLDSGFINVEIHEFPHSATPPGVIDENGGTITSSEGDLHLQIPPGALTSAVPVVLTSLNVDSVHLPLQDYKLVTAFEVDFSGAILALPAVLDAPATLPANPQLILARLTPGYWVYDGTASYDGNRMTTGITAGGVYGIFHAQIPIGFLSGTVTNPQSHPAGQGILVSSSANPLRAITSAASTYTLAVPVGPGTAAAANPITGDSGLSAYVISSAGELVTLNIQILTTPPQIVSITPAADATNVPQNTAVRVTFSEPVLASSVNSSSLFLQNVSATILLTANNTIAILTPTTQLAPNTQFTLTVTSAIRDLTGNALSNPVSNHVFTTVDNAAPAPGDAQFKLFLPEGPDAPNDGIVRFEVDASQIESGLSLVFFNNTQQISISATLQNGKYTASLAGRITDEYFVLLIDASGNQTRVDLPLMQYLDGLGAAFKPEGGIFVTTENIEIIIQPGTFDSITPVRLETIQVPEDQLPPHEDFLPLQHFTLNLNGASAQHEIEIAIPPPPGITEDSQVFVMKPVEVFGHRKWMAMEIMQLVDGKLRTLSPPWPGVQEQAITSGDNYSITAASIPMYFLQGSVGSLPAVLEFSNSNLAILLFNNLGWIVPLPLGEPYTLTVSNPVTGETLFQGTPAPPASEIGGVVHLQTPLSPDQEAPYVVGGTPLTFSAWRIGAAAGSIRSNITFVATDSNSDGVADIQGTIRIIGNAGALPDQIFVAARNNRSGDVMTATTAANGSFQTPPLQYQFGDPITVLFSSNDVELNAPLRFQFSEPLHTQSNFQSAILCETDASNNCVVNLPFTHQLLNSQQILQITPGVAFKEDQSYRLLLQGVQDLSHNPVVGNINVHFKTSGFGTTDEGSSGIVNDTFLLRNHLLVAKETGIEVYDLANPFNIGAPVASMTLVGGVRSFARLGACNIDGVDSDECVVVVGGGVGGHFGLLRVLNFENVTSPSVMKDFVISRFLGDPSDDPPFGQPSSYPEGRPFKVIVEGTKAYVGNVGVGVQIVDLSQLNTAVFLPPHKKVAEPYLKDVAIYMKGSPLIQDVLLAGLSMHSLIDVDFDGELDSVPVSFRAVNTQNLAEVTRVPSGNLPGLANNIEVFQDFEIDRDGVTEIHDLAFIGSGSCGIHILDITCLGDDLLCTSAPPLLGTIYLGTGPTSGSCGDSISVLDLKLDRKNKRLYVPAGGAGIYIVDITDPFLINTQPTIGSQVIGRIEFSDGTIADGEVTIDEELNAVYVATRDGFKSVLTGNLQIGIFTDANLDGQIDDPVGFVDSEGIIKNHTTGEPWLPGTKLSDLQAQDPLKYYVVAYLPSAAGADVQIKLQSTNFYDQPLKLGAGFPETEIDLMMHYQAPSDTQQSYRLYRSDAFYITAHPLVPTDAKKESPSSKVIAAGDSIKLAIDDGISQNLDWVDDDLLRRSVASVRAIRMDYIDSENPEPKQNPAIGSGETSYPPYLHSGEFTLPAVDLSIKGRGFDYVFARKYESQCLYDGPLGMGWDHAYFARLIQLWNGDVFYIDGMGDKDYFKAIKDVNGKIIRYESPRGVFAELKRPAEASWLLHHPDGTLHFFDGYGRLDRIFDRNENYVQLSYGPSGKLDVLTDTMGRPIYYAYDDNDKLKSITDFSGRKVLFAYDAVNSSLLKSVTSPAVTGTSNGNDFPNGKTTEYSYQGGADITKLADLKTIESPNGDTFLTNSYNAAGQLGSQNFIHYSISFTYQPGKTTVTDGNAGAIIHNLDTTGHTASIEVPLGSESAITLWQYNTDGLITKVTRPLQGTTEYTYHINGTRRSQANLLSETITPDSRGDSNGGNEPIEKSYTYDALHNLMLTSTNGRGHTTEFKLDAKGRNVADVKTPLLEDDGDNFLIESYQYNIYGQVTQHTDPIGNVDTYEYYSEGQSAPTAVRSTDSSTGGYLKLATMAFSSASAEGQLNDASPQEQLFKYDSRGNVISTIDARSVETRMEVNQLDQLIRRTDAFTGSDDGAPALGYLSEYQYDANDNLVDVLIPKNLATKESHIQAVYDELNRQIEVIQHTGFGAQLSTKYEYDGRDNVKKITYPRTARESTNHEYDVRDLVTQTTEGSAITTNVYDKNGNLVQSTTPDTTITYEFDGFDRQTKTQYAEGNFVEVTYDANNNQTSSAVFGLVGGNEKLFSKRLFSYDFADRLFRTEDAFFEDAINRGDPFETATTQYFYDSNSRTTQVVNPRGNDVQYVYDGLDRTRIQIDAAENSVEMEYDKIGNLIERTEVDQLPSGEERHTWKYEYDALSRKTAETAPNDDRSTMSYDERGNVLAETDARGKKLTHDYDGLDRKIIDKTEALPGACQGNTVYIYDADSNLTDYQDPCLLLTVYTYDSLNRLQSVKYPDDTTEVYTYLGGGNRLANYKDRNGTIIIPTYDGNVRITAKQIQLAEGVDGTTLENFGYDGLDRVISATDNDSNTAQRWNSFSDVIEEIQNFGTINVRATYDKAGNRETITYPTGLVLSSEYDTLERPKNFYLSSSLIADQTYAGRYRMREMNFGNLAKAEFTYDQKKRLEILNYTGLINSTSGARALFDGIKLGYDNADNKTSIIATYRPQQYTDNFTYNEAVPGRLRIADKKVPEALAAGRINFVSKKEDYRIDKADHINSVQKVRNDSEQALSIRFHDTAGRFESQRTGQEEIQAVYDGNGNQIKLQRVLGAETRLIREITYDYRNHPVKITLYQEDGVTPRDNITFKYDALGRRIEKSSDTRGEVDYVLFGQDVIHELYGSGKQISYIYRGIDQPLGMLVDNNPGVEMFYFHSDDIGNSHSLTKEGGEVVERYYYDSYGLPTIIADSESPEVLRITQTTTDVEVEFSEEMTDTALQSVFVNSTGTATFVDASHTKVRWTYEDPPDPGTPLEITVSAQAFDLSLRHHQVPLTVPFEYAGEPEVYTAPDPTKYTGEKLQSESTIGNLLLFHGARFEPESDLIFLRARFFDPQLQIFLSPDPMGYEDSSNLYQFAAYNPLSNRDSTGKLSSPWHVWNRFRSMGAFAEEVERSEAMQAVNRSVRFAEYEVNGAALALPRTISGLDQIFRHPIQTKESIERAATFLGERIAEEGTTEVLSDVGNAILDSDPDKIAEFMGENLFFFGSRMLLRTPEAARYITVISGGTNQLSLPARIARTVLKPVFRRIARIPRRPIRPGQALPFSIKIRRVFLQDRLSHPGVPYSPTGSFFQRLFPNIRLQQHHAVVQRRWFRPGSATQWYPDDILANRGLQRIGDAGWNLVPIPAVLNQALGRTSLGTVSFAGTLYGGSAYVVYQSLNGVSLNEE